MNDILIPIETSFRELIYKVYLCHNLALKGFKCYLGKKSHIDYLINKFKGYIYMDKGYHKGVSEKIYNAIKLNDGIIVNLDEEGVLDQPDRSVLIGRYSKTLFDYADFSFFWGSKQYDLVKHNISSNTKTAISGHPRFQLLKSKYHILYSNEVKKIKNRFPDYILINTNMASGNHINGDDFILKVYSDRVSNIDQLISFNKIKLETYRLLVIELSKQFNKQIIIRPHPEEDHGFYINAFKKQNNVHVIYEGSVIPWILASYLLIHPDCTTGIESLLLGKKPISFLPNNYPSDLITKLPLKASYRFTEQDALISFVKNKYYLQKSVDLSEYKFVEDYFSFSKDSIEIIVNKLSQQFLCKESNKSNQLIFSDSLLLNYKSIRSKLKFNKSSRLGRNKRKGFNYSKINLIKARCNQLNSDFNEVKLCKISNDLFLFLHRKLI